MVLCHEERSFSPYLLDPKHQQVFGTFSKKVHCQPSSAKHACNHENAKYVANDERLGCSPLALEEFARVLMALKVGVAM